MARDFRRRLDRLESAAPRPGVWEVLYGLADPAMLSPEDHRLLDRLCDPAAALAPIPVEAALTDLEAAIRAGDDASAALAAVTNAPRPWMRHPPQGVTRQGAQP